MQIMDSKTNKMKLNKLKYYYILTEIREFKYAIRFEVH
jgi:hypothetical protein